MYIYVHNNNNKTAKILYVPCGFNMIFTQK